MAEQDFYSIIKKMFAQCAIPLTEEQAQKMQAYYECLIAENAKYNLTTITDPRTAAADHFLDSVTPYMLIPAGAKLIDVGSGGGFPAIPLSIMRNDIKVTALEATQKKCNFILEASVRANINVSVVNARAEEYARADGREKYDVCVSRAVAALPVLMELCVPLIKPGGLFFAYKTEDGKELQIARNAVRLLGLKLEKTQKTPLQKSHRVVYIFKKTGQTAELYPRKYGKILKKPL